MIALVMAAALAVPVAGPSAPPADTTGTEAPAVAVTRMPGTWMRLGDTEGRILARAQFPEVEGKKAPGAVQRQGPALWFGLAGNVTLQFRGEHLEQAEFTIEEAAPYWIDYARDQLRLAGYRPHCAQDMPGAQICNWYGAALVRLEVRQDRLVAKITHAEPPPAPARPHAVHPPVGFRDTVAVFPQVFVLGRGAPAGVRAPALADSTPLVSPAYPQRARDAGVQGRIWVRALVDTNGAVLSAEVLRSIPELDSAAVAVARRCRFRPYEAEGAPVRFRVEIPVRFTAR